MQVDADEVCNWIKAMPCIVGKIMKLGLKFVLMSIALFGAISSVQAAKGKIGVTFPTQNEAAYYIAGPKLTSALQKLGYETELYYGADNDIPIQQAQIPRMINEDHVNAMIISPIDANSLVEELKIAKAKNIPVVSFDRLVMYSNAVDYYVGFDNSKVGQLQAQAMIKELKLYERTASDPAYIEMVAGDPKDPSAEAIFTGFLQELLPFIDDGRVVIPSNEFFFVMCAIPRGSTDSALKRMAILIENQGYSPNGKKLDAVYCVSDEIAEGVLRALKNAGFSNDNMPYLTGRDATDPAIEGIINGQKRSTVYRDPNMLISSTTKLIDDILQGKKPEFNDNSSYNDGIKMMNSMLCDPVLVDASNVKKLFPDFKIEH